LLDERQLTSNIRRPEMRKRCACQYVISLSTRFSTEDTDLASIERKIDATLCMAALLAAFSFFLWISVPVVRNGLSHADDAVLAHVAKSVAVGKGYGLEMSKDDFSLFDPGVSTGPTLIVPIAFLIWVFGAVDQLPGAATLVIFIAQLIIAAIAISRRFGWAPTCGFFSVLLWLLALASANTMFFGVFIGEAVAFGFILIGTALLAAARRDRAIGAAGLCFSLAFLTKQISLFAVIGVVGGWLVVSAYNHEQRALIFRRVAILVLVGSSLPLAFEAAKLVTLGLVGYQDLWKITLKATASQAIGTANPSERLTTFLTVLRSYMLPSLLIGLAIGSAVLLALSRRTQVKGHESVGRFAILAWTGAAAYLLYILMVSILWPRYFWIGIALLFTAISAPLLALQSRLRMAFIMIVLVGTLGLGLHRPLLLVRKWISNSHAPAERAAIVRLLDEHPQLPYAAQWWACIFDVLYLRREEGIWAIEPNVIRLQDRDFIALINDVFTDKEGRFFKSVVATCEPLTPRGRLTAYSCGERFWGMYSLSASSPKSPVGVALPYYGAVDRRDCETVGGWVMTSADPEADIKVELYIDDKLAETLPAQNLRPDLANKFGTGRYGFSFKIPATYKDKRPHLVNVKVAGSDHSVPFYQGVSSSFECKLN
jgi:hypothetical protein